MIYEPFPLKRCSKCRNFKPKTLQYFNGQKRSKDGLRGDCRDCRKLEYYANPEVNRQRSLEWQQRNPERANERKRRWVTEHYEHVLDYHRQYQANNRDRLNQWHRERRLALRKPRVIKSADPNYQYLRRRNYRESHKSEIWEKEKTRRAANREKYRLRKRQYVERNQHKIREQKQISEHRRRAHKRELPGRFTTEDWQKALDYWQGRCAYCGGQPSSSDRYSVLHADHYIPLSDSDCPGSVPINMIPACQDCNLSKHNNLPHEWLCSKFGENQAEVIERRIAEYVAVITSL